MRMERSSPTPPARIGGDQRPQGPQDGFGDVIEQVKIVRSGPEYGGGTRT